MPSHYQLAALIWGCPLYLFGFVEGMVFWLKVWLPNFLPGSPDLTGLYVCKCNFQFFKFEIRRSISNNMLALFSFILSKIHPKFLTMMPRNEHDADFRSNAQKYNVEIFWASLVESNSKFDSLLLNLVECEATLFRLQSHWLLRRSHSFSMFNLFAIL